MSNAAFEAVCARCEHFDSPPPSEELHYWSEVEGFPSEDWQYEVANGDTRAGYWEWVEAQMGIEEAP